MHFKLIFSYVLLCFLLCSIVLNLINKVKNKHNHTSCNDCQTCFIAQSIILSLAVFITLYSTLNIQRSLHSGFKERILTDDLLEESVLDVGLRSALRGHGVREGMDGGFPLSGYLGVSLEWECRGLLWSCSRLVRKGWKGHGLIHGRKDIDHAIRASHCGLICMIVVVVVMLMLMEMSVFVLVVQDQLMVMFMGLPIFVTILVVMVLPLILTVLMGFGVMGVSMVVIVRVGMSMALAMFMCVVVA